MRRRSGSGRCARGPLPVDEAPYEESRLALVRGRDQARTVRPGEALAARERELAGAGAPSRSAGGGRRRVSWLRLALRTAAWYLREVTGESGYDRYLARQRSHHPDRPPLSRREFERRRADELECNTNVRCC
jgi:uncharacterized short protein YbdD (DUF466 family)